MGRDRWSTALPRLAPLCGRSVHSARSHQLSASPCTRRTPPAQYLYAWVPHLVVKNPRLLQHLRLVLAKPRLWRQHRRLLAATSAPSAVATVSSARVLVLLPHQEECRLATRHSLRVQHSLCRRKGAQQPPACSCRTHTVEEIQAVGQQWASPLPPGSPVP